MASSLRRRDVLLKQHLERQREIENGKVYIRPDTEPIVSLKTSIFTSRHLSYNSTTNLLLAEACDKEYRLHKQSESNAACNGYARICIGIFSRRGNGLKTNIAV